MKDKFQIYKYPLVIIFLLIIFLPGLNNVSGVLRLDRMDENRAFRDSLNINISNLDVFPGQFEDFFNDNFSFRRPFLDAYHYTKFYYFRVSPNPEKLIIGSNGWYFMAGKEKDIFEGKVDFTENELNKFKRVWSERKNYLDSLKIKHYWVICPVKHFIYPEYLPLNVAGTNKPPRSSALMDLMNTNFPGLIIDPSTELLDAKTIGKVFYQLDNHWNYKAGYITSKKILQRIEEDFENVPIGEISNFSWTDTIFQNGIHYRVLGQDNLFEVDQKAVFIKEKSKEVPGYDFDPPKGFIYPWEYQRRFLNESDTLGIKVLIIRDSFANQIIPFLKEAFYESVFIFDDWKYRLNEDIIEIVKPDIVIFITVETELESLLN